jgi:hypothetical protein
MRLALLVISVLCSSSVFSQLDTLFSRSYGGPFYDVGAEILETDDGGYLILGTTGSALNSTTDFYLLKIDEALDYSWSLPIGAGDVDQGTCMVRTGDNYLLGGYSKYTETTYDFQLYKVNGDGQVLWSTSYGDEGWDFGSKMTIDDDGNIYFLGTTHQDTEGGTDLLLFKIDEDGNELWSERYGGEEDEEVGDIALLPTGNIVIHSTSMSFADEARAWTFVIDPDGDMVWEDIGGDIKRIGKGLDIADGGIVTVGANVFVEGQEVSAYMQKFSYDGATLFERQESSDWIQYYNDVELGNTYYAVSGFTATGLGGADVLVNRRNINGYWSGGMATGGIYADDGTEVMIDSEGRVLVLGWTEGYSENLTEDVLLLRFVNDTIVVNYEIDIEDFNDVSLSVSEELLQSAVYPNPTRGESTFSIDEGIIDGIMIHNSTGQIVFQSQFAPTKSHRIRHDLAAGMYFYTLISDKKIVSKGKLVAR